MKAENYLDPEKLNRWMKSIFDNATVHGWHDKPISPEHYCGLIMTEMAEAVEADRNSRRFSVISAPPEHPQRFQQWYQACVKGTIEEEFADVVIRILDMAQELYGDKMRWFGYYPYSQVYDEERKSFIENAWYFIREVLNWGTMNISDCVSFMYDWAHHLGIDLDKHIEWKMKYNELRPYKHGGKKY